MNILAKSPFHKYLIQISRSTSILRSKVRLLPSKTHYYINPQSQSNHNTLKPIHKYIHTHTHKQPTHPPKMSEPSLTFQLWEFTLLHGKDMHYLLLIQLTHNETSLANLKRNLNNAISRKEVVIHPRVYTHQDVINIQTSAIEIIRLFESTNDCVDLIVVSGELDVKKARHKSREKEEEWFEDLMGDSKFPRWEGLGGRVVSLFEGRYWPVEGEEEAS
ncbi:hypothetical protein HDV62DRAFT_370773 [Trichoderma sp. SZMC 28011]